MFTTVQDRVLDQRNERLARARELSERYYVAEMRWNKACGECASCGRHAHLTPARNGAGICCCCYSDMTGESALLGHRCASFDSAYGSLLVEADRLAANGGRG